jgi:hypothetical protein
MRPPVIVVLHPQPHALAGRFETVKLRALEELLPDRLPEAFDFPQGHGVMRPALDVMDPVFPQFPLETRGPAPTRVLAPLIRKHLLGHAVLRYRSAVHLQHMLRRLAAEHVQADDVPGVVIQEADEICVLSPQPEGENIGLPHLVGSRAFEEAWTGWILLGFAAGLLDQLLLMQSPTNRLPAYRQK